MSTLITPADLAAKAEAVREFMNEHTERLDFENYDSLREIEAQLEALAEYLTHPDPQACLVNWLDIVDKELRFYADYLGLDAAE